MLPLAVRFDPIAGGWISESQFNSTGVHSPGTKEEGGNGNLRSGAPAVTIKEEPAPGSKSYGITLGPTEMLLMQSQEKNPFSFPSCTRSSPVQLCSLRSNLSADCVLVQH